MIDQVISDRYVIKQIVGSGGMAVVYRAWDLKEKKTVAIKVLRPEYESDREFVRRFGREAEAAAKMSHGNIVNMLDVGTEGDMRYIVMEYVDGMTLKDMIREKGVIDPASAVRIIRSILAAVEHAHSNGIVHRDIKPQNILVDKKGCVKVADFGIARVKDAAQTTRVDGDGGSALGSVHYFSPEQARGEIADEKSDLYSVGIVLYEMLTGTVPFDGENSVSVALKHVSEAPKSMREYHPEIPQALDEIVMRALSKDTFKRYQTAAEMASDLGKAAAHPKGGFVKYPLSKEEQEARREERKRANIRRRRRLIRLAVAASIVVLFLIGAAGTLYFKNLFRTVEVPSLSGHTQAEMQTTLEQRGLTLEVMTEYSEDIAEGSLIRQFPEAGSRQKLGKSVQAVLSLGSEWYYLGSYVARDLDSVLTALEKSGVENVTTEEVLSDKEVDTVIAQSPQAGWHSRKEGVLLQISGESTHMPSLNGLLLDGAQALIEAQGLVLGSVTSGYSADAPAGSVIAQSVEPNSQVLLGTVVNLTVSQSQNPQFYPESDFFVVVPLDNVDVSVVLATPSGLTLEAFSDTLSSGSHVVSLTSEEPGLHTVEVIVDGILIETTQVLFE